MIYLNKNEPWPKHWPLAASGGREEKDKPFRYVVIDARNQWLEKHLGLEPEYLLLGPTAKDQMLTDVNSMRMVPIEREDKHDEYMGMKVLFSRYAGLELLGG